jgi:hypothetical protein
LPKAIRSSSDTDLRLTVRSGLHDLTPECSGFLSFHSVCNRDSYQSSQPTQESDRYAAMTAEQ